MTGPLVIDGAHGEGGGQILRTAVALSAITGRALRVENIRAKRPNPGLAAQHVTSVRAAGALCDAALAGDVTGSPALDFTPRRAVQAGTYGFDVADARKDGSAGAAMLVLQAVLPPLLIARGDSRLSIKGGTHMAWSPPFDYVRDVWLPMLGRMGARADASLVVSGWFPVGQGEVDVTVTGADGPLAPLTVHTSGPLQRVTGRAIAASLPAHIAARMANRASALLRETNVEARIDAQRLRAACPGAGIFLAAIYETGIGGFSALGERGKPAERVAEEAVEDFISHDRTGATFDVHLADQMILPMALASGPSEFTTPRLTRHLVTNAWVVERFGVADVTLEQEDSGPARVTVTPRIMH
jgi:RNA 3'-terminal phosphate cyclase (ATP)